MNRRKLLRGVGLTAAATAISAPAIAQSTPTLRWRLTTSFPKTQGERSATGGRSPHTRDG
jgi:TRAP-type mannitol/chloroaromatic compound transport system substrate-binding protein